MNYCSIDDAWGKSNSISNQFKNHMNSCAITNNNSNSEDENSIDNIPYTNGSNVFNKTNPRSISKIDNIEHFSNQQNKIVKNKQNYNYEDDNFEFNQCDNFMNHIKTCRKCYNKMKYQFRSHLIENFQEIVDDNRDTIVLILLGIFILLFFNLINNLTK